MTSWPPAVFCSSSSGQWPEAVVLGCIDSRAPAELIFDQGLGDIFNGRVAGNVESPDMLGRFEFATKLSGAKAIVVVGHSACGVVKGTMARQRSPAVSTTCPRAGSKSWPE